MWVLVGFEHGFLLAMLSIAIIYYHHLQFCTQATPSTQVAEDELPQNLRRSPLGALHILTFTNIWLLSFHDLAAAIWQSLILYCSLPVAAGSDATLLLSCRYLSGAKRA